jgi:hypothetical protein
MENAAEPMLVEKFCQVGLLGRHRNRLATGSTKPQPKVSRRKQNQIANVPYHTCGHAEYVDKRPLGPATGAYCFIGDPSHCDDTFTNDDQCKEAHSDGQMSVFETDIWSDVRDAHHHPHFKPEQDKPNGPNVRVNSMIFLKGKIHLSPKSD